MTAFDVVIILGGVCGLLMVVGGMILLYKGAISLNKASKKDAVSLEFKKMIKVTTQYPALGLFIIGLAFIISAAMFSKPTGVSPLKIQGHVNVPDPSSVTIFVSAGRWSLEPFTDGTIKGLIHPSLGLLKVEITAPGYIPPTITKSIGTEDIKFGVVSLGEIAFGNRIVEKPLINPDNIKTPTEHLPPLTEGGKF